MSATDVPELFDDLSDGRSDGRSVGAVRYDDVPAADPDAMVDPHWLDLRAGGLLPTPYMPPPMPGRTQLPGWLRLVAVALVVLFLGATAAGVCLTYGTPHGW